MIDRIKKACAPHRTPSCQPLAASGASTSHLNQPERSKSNDEQRETKDGERGGQVRGQPCLDDMIVWCGGKATIGERNRRVRFPGSVRAHQSLNRWTTKEAGVMCKCESQSMSWYDNGSS